MLLYPYGDFQNQVVRYGLAVNLDVVGVLVVSETPYKSSVVGQDADEVLFQGFYLSVTHDNAVLLLHFSDKGDPWIRPLKFLGEEIS